MDYLRTHLPPEVLALLTDRNWQIGLGTAALVLVLGCCRIFARTGRHPALGLLMIVPGVNLLMFLFLAFGPWPAGTELRALRRVQRAAQRAERKIDNLAA